MERRHTRNLGYWAASITNMNGKERDPRTHAISGAAMEAQI
jgi:hypothetical protein